MTPHVTYDTSPTFSMAIHFRPPLRASCSVHVTLPLCEHREATHSERGGREVLRVRNGQGTSKKIKDKRCICCIFIFILIYVRMFTIVLIFTIHEFNSCIY